jgi:succinate dehydrogenase / fumarate reductase membrane anchor subunit
MAETNTRSRMRTPLGRAIGLGSAKEGVDHWWAERITALALVPLTLWFVVAVIQLVGADRAAFVEWIRHPVPAVLLVLLLIATFYHNALGLQVVIEDYVENEALRFGLIIIIKLVSVVLTVLGIFAVLKLSIAG